MEISLSTRVKVWNDNTIDLDDKLLSGDPIFIKAGGFVEMAYSDAVAFKGEPIRKLTLTKSGEPEPFYLDEIARIQNPKRMKKLRIEFPQEAQIMPEMTAFRCMQCNHSLLSQKELDTHIEVHHPIEKREVIGVKPVRRTVDITPDTPSKAKGVADKAHQQIDTPKPWDQA